MDVNMTVLRVRKLFQNFEGKLKLNSSNTSVLPKMYSQKFLLVSVHFFLPLPQLQGGALSEQMGVACKTASTNRET